MCRVSISRKTFMKHLFKILFATVFLSVFSLINLGYAAHRHPQQTHFITIENDSQFSLTIQSITSTSPVSFSTLLPSKILASSSFGPVTYSFKNNKSNSKLSIIYKFSSGHYCKISYKSPNFVATVSPSTDLVICKVGSHNIVHMNVVSPYHPRANCLRRSAWSVNSGTNATCALGKITCNLGQPSFRGADCETITECRSVAIQIHADPDNYWGQHLYICLSPMSSCGWPLSHARIQRNCARQVKYDAYLTKYYGN